MILSSFLPGQVGPYSSLSSCPLRQLGVPLPPPLCQGEFTGGFLACVWSLLGDFSQLAASTASCYALPSHPLSFFTSPCGTRKLSLTRTHAQEAGNVPYVTENQFGLYHRKPTDIARAVSDLLADREKLEMMGAHARALGRPQASLDIARSIVSNLLPGTVEISNKSQAATS